MEDDDNVTSLPVRFKQPPDENFTLVQGKTYACFHGPFIVDQAKAEVECEKCGEKLNPMWVLVHLCGKLNTDGKESANG